MLTAVVVNWYQNKIIARGAIASTRDLKEGD